MWNPCILLCIWTIFLRRFLVLTRAVGLHSLPYCSMGAFSTYCVIVSTRSSNRCVGVLIWHRLLSVPEYRAQITALLPQVYWAMSNLLNWLQRKKDFLIVFNPFFNNRSVLLNCLKLIHVSLKRVQGLRVYVLLLTTLQLQGPDLLLEDLLCWVALISQPQ